MFASVATRPFPKPVELGVRVLIAGILVLSVLYHLQRVIVEPLIPAFARAVHLIDPDFTVLGSTVEHNGSNPTVLIRANLELPIRLAGRTLYPFGWVPGQSASAIEVWFSLSGLMQFSAMMFIIVLAWPVRRLLELLLRSVLCLPLMAALLFLQAPFTVVAELWVFIFHELAPGRFNGWLLWSRFLMGGGGLLLASLCALIAVVAARRMTAAPAAAALP
jgi:hypothetical protein